MADLPIIRIEREYLGFCNGPDNRRVPMLYVETESSADAYTRDTLVEYAEAGEGWAAAYLARLDRLTDANRYIFSTDCLMSERTAVAMLALPGCL